MTRWVLRLYPAWFRARYGDELADLVNPIIDRATYSTSQSPLAEFDGRTA